MTTISFEKLPEAVAELNSKVDRLLESVVNARPQVQAERYLSVEETADFLNLSVPTIYSKVSKRELPYMKRGKRLYFLREDIEAYLKGGRIKTVKEIESEVDLHLVGKGNRR